MSVIVFLLTVFMILRSEWRINALKAKVKASEDNLQEMVEIVAMSSDNIGMLMGMQASSIAREVARGANFIGYNGDTTIQ
jgi:hypothetical protein